MEKDQGIKLFMAGYWDLPPRRYSMYVVHLTTSQKNAITLVLLEAIRDENHTREFIDVLTDHTITLDQLLTLISTAEEV